MTMGFMFLTTLQNLRTTCTRAWGEFYRMHAPEFKLSICGTPTLCINLVIERYMFIDMSSVFLWLVP